MKIAVIHDWLMVKGGAELVLREILALFPEADIYTIVNFIDKDSLPELKSHKIFPSFIQKMPFSRKKYRAYLPFMPIAIEQFDLSAYDLIISSSYAVAKGVITGPDQLHVSYIHSPIRYAWDLQHTYLKETGFDKGIRSIFARAILHYIRMWDQRTVNSVDVVIANSKFIAKRIRKIYRREATVIYPPVDTDAFSIAEEKEDFYLTASRLVPYKKIPLIVEAFSRMEGKRLVVIGEGPEESAARSHAGPNVTFLGHQTRESLISHMRRARAFVFAAEEDFGIVPVEAQACGTPVIAFGKGGSLETVIDGRTGLFFNEQTPESIIDAVTRFELIEPRLDAAEIRRNALRFDRKHFAKSFADVLRDSGVPIASRQETLQIKAAI